MHLENGTVFAKDYKVVSPLSQGGMGTIYIVEQLSTGRRRALKLMLPEFVQNAQLRQRFEQEAKVAARIESDHVVQVIAAGIDEASGCPWLAMELLKGQTLEQRVTQRGLLLPLEIASIFTQLCHGLRAAHAVNVVHRDLKPENIYLADIAREGGTSLVKILDFGIARISAEAKATKTAAMGTPLWMSPEQAKAGSLIGPRTDIWALGLIAFWMITGKEYWLAASSPDVTPLMLMNEVLIQPLELASMRISTLGGRQPPEGFDAWFAACVSRQIEERFPDVDAALHALVPLLQRMHEAMGYPAHTPSTDGFLRASPVNAFEVAQMRASGPGAEGTPRPGGTLMGSPIDMAAAAAATHTPQPGSYGTDLRGSYPSYPGQPPGMSPHPGHASNPAYQSQPHGQTWLGQMPHQPGSTGPGFHAPTGAPITTSAPRAPVAPSSSNGGLIAGFIIGGLVLLGGVGYGVSRLVASRTSSSTSAECDGRDVDACEKACSTARDKDDSDASKICASYGHALLLKGNAEKALPVLAKACDDKPGAICDEVGSIYAFSSQATHDTKKAVAMFQRACDTHVFTGCAHLGVAKELGWADGGAKEALDLYDKACQGGDGHACIYQAAALAAGRGGKIDTAKATTLRAKAKSDLDTRCKSDDAEACSLSGVVSEIAADPSNARASYKSGCDAGDLLGCNNLARLDAEGIGGSADLVGALTRFGDLCGKGDGSACDNAAIMESKWPAQLRYGPRGEAVYKFRCKNAMTTGCSGWGDEKVIGGGSGDLPKTVESLTRGCDGGASTACVNLGGLLFIGQGAKKDRPHAHELFNKACYAGDPTGCGEGGSLYFSDYVEQPADSVKAMSMLQAACDGGELDACAIVLANKAAGSGTAKALPEALQGLKGLCEDRKFPLACREYAQALVYDSNEKNATDPAGSKAEVDKAKKLDTDDCDGSGDACASLAEVFYGNDPKSAFGIFQKGCDKGQFESCSELGHLYEDGIGVDKNPKAAFDIFDKACKAGHSQSCGRLAPFYLEGLGDMKPDEKRGAQLSKEACDDGDMRGCDNYGLCLMTGTGVDKDTNAASPYLKKACGAGFQDACKSLKDGG